MDQKYLKQLTTDKDSSDLIRLILSQVNDYRFPIAPTKETKLEMYDPFIEEVRRNPEAINSHSVFKNAIDSEFDTINSGIAIITMECDEHTLDVLYEQLDNLSPSSKNHIQKSRMYQFHNSLKRYGDYLGCNVAYSGNWSLHYHFIFNTYHLNKELCTQSNRSLGKWKNNTSDATFYEMCRLVFTDLKTEFEQFFELKADPALASPKQFRRLPHGTRLLDTRQINSHPFASLTRTRKIRQTVLWDQLSSRSYPEARSMMFDDGKYQTAAAKPKPVRSGYRAPTSVFPELERQLDAWCKENFPGLTLAHVDSYKGEPRAKFFNGPHDRKAGSYVYGDMKKIILIGEHDFLEDFYLPISLNQWARCIADTVNIYPRKPNGLEQLFQFQTKISDARTALSNLAPIILHGFNTFILCSSEGIGKSTRFIELLMTCTGPRYVASISYAQSFEKFEAFKRSSNMPAVFLRSASKYYSLACEELEEKPVSIYDGSLIEYASNYQPNVFARMIEMRNEAWNGNKIDECMIFTVHALHKTWLKSLKAIAFLHPDFDIAQIDDSKYLMGLKNDLKPAYLLYDEIAPTDLIEFLTQEQYEAIKRMQNSLDWDKATTTEKHYAYYKLTGEEQDTVSAHVAVNVNLSDYEQITLDFNKEPFGKDNSKNVNDHIYKSYDGQPAYIHKQEWFKYAADHVAITTTETLPMLISEKLGIKTLNFMPIDKQTEIPFIKHDKAHKEGLKELARDVNEAFPGIFIVTNHASSLTLPNVCTHQGVQGSNLLSETDIAQIQMMISPQQYAYLNALAAGIELASPIKHFYMDIINQTIGRNKGYRDTGHKHILIIHPYLSLYLQLEELSRSSRYQLVEFRELDRNRKGDRIPAPNSILIRCTYSLPLFE